jgi:hypothetical protein
MNPRPSSPRVIRWLAIAWVLALTSSATATPRDRHLARRNQVPAALPAPPSAPPLPPVALQLSGLRVRVPVPRTAVIHALARDVWPELVKCVTPPPRVRGFVTVEVREVREAGDALDIRVDGGPPARDSRLTACVRRAVARVELPPYEGDAPTDASVAFDLAFGVPPLGTKPSDRGTDRASRRMRSTQSAASSRRPCGRDGSPASASNSPRAPGRSPAR